MNPDEMIPLERESDDPFERALLRAARRERAPEGADRRLLAALGAGSAGGLGALATKYAARLGPKNVLATVALGAALVAVTHWAVTREPERVAPAVAPPVAGIPAPAVTPSAVIEEPRSEAMPSTRVEDLPSSRPPPAEPRPAVAAGASARAPDEAAPGGLAREVALVEEARVALARGDAAAALRALDAHAREFPSGTLSPEARVLRIEALVRAGGEKERSEAHRLGDAFLAAHPSGPHARRVRAVLGRAP
ncbi:MAG: hypothetical protein KF850_04515 [Labilithrix sp.]|nr:hypothetical protein [Labilithrix sp.]